MAWRWRRSVLNGKAAPGPFIASKRTPRNSAGSWPLTTRSPGRDARGSCTPPQAGGGGLCGGSFRQRADGRDVPVAMRDQRSGPLRPDICCEHCSRQSGPAGSRDGRRAAIQQSGSVAAPPGARHPRHGDRPRPVGPRGFDPWAVFCPCESSASVRFRPRPFGCFGEADELLRAVAPRSGLAGIED